MPWIQYSSADGSQQGTNSSQVLDGQLQAIGRAQIFYPLFPDGVSVNINVVPPVAIAAVQSA